MDIIALEQHFAEELESCYDGVAGDGLQVRVDRGEDRRPLLLQVFPETQIARLTTPLLDVTLRRAQVEPADGSDSLWLSGTSDEEWTRVMLQRNGNVVIASYLSTDYAARVAESVKEAMAQERREGPAAHGLSEESSSEEEEIPERVVYDIPASEAAAPDPLFSSEPANAPNKIEQERVTLKGRVGVEPRFRTTKNDKLVCSFPLAVHEDDGSTKWHDVVTFGERAVKLQESLRKGHEIQIVGYVHTKQVPGKDGKPKEKREIWAAVIRRPKAP